MSSIRLDRYLADVHVGSRKEIREYIRDGRVRVGDEVVTRTETHVDTEEDRITLDGQLLAYSKYRYYMLHKPAGVVTATRDGLSRTVVELLKNVPVRGLSPVGRLDKDTEGLLLLTDDGALLHRLISPGYHVEKVYEAHLDAPVTDGMLQCLSEGVDIGDDTKTLPATAVRLAQDEEGRDVVELTIREGRFHQVKRMFHALGREVVFLKRVAFAGLVLDPNLKTGAYRTLSSAEITALKEVPDKSGETQKG